MLAITHIIQTFFIFVLAAEDTFRQISGVDDQLIKLFFNIICFGPAAEVAKGV